MPESPSHLIWPEPSPDIHEPNGEPRHVHRTTDRMESSDDEAAARPMSSSPCSVIDRPASTNPGDDTTPHDHTTVALPQLVLILNAGLVEAWTHIIPRLAGTPALVMV